MVLERFRAGESVWAVGVYDALSALLAKDAGFDVVMTGGFGVTASLLGLPDHEFLTLTENVGVVSRISSLGGLAVVADIDTGYGSTMGVQRAVGDFARAGAAAVIIEDQVSPKSCPACATSVELIDISEAVAKIKAARSVAGEQVAVIARTDAFDPEEACVRAAAYASAGADLIQPISKTFSEFEGLRRLRERCGVPLSLQLLGWLETDLSREQIVEVAGLATFTFVPLLTAAQALRQNLSALKSALSAEALPAPRMPLAEFSDLLGFDEWTRRQEIFYL